MKTDKYGSIMKIQEELFYKNGQSLTDAEQSLMFGKPCFKVNKKAFCCFFNDCMVFKLSGDAHKNALSLNNSVLSDPSGKNRPMKEWVQVSFENSDKWQWFTE